MQSVYLQILSLCQIHSAWRMGVKGWNLPSMLFCLFTYICWRTSAAQWTDCCKDTKISGYSHNSSFGKPRNSWGQKAHLEFILFSLLHTGPTRVNHMVWLTVVLPSTFLEITECSTSLARAVQAWPSAAWEDRALVAQLSQAHFSGLSFCTGILWYSSVDFGLHSKWSIDMPVEYSKHRSTGKKIFHVLPSA